MGTKKIQGWLAYWNAAKMVALDEIRAFEHVFQARKYCECMRVNVFAEVSDLAIWNALAEMRRRPRRSSNSLELMKAHAEVEEWRNAAWKNGSAAQELLRVLRTLVEHCENMEAQHPDYHSEEGPVRSAPLNEASNVLVRIETSREVHQNGP